MSNVQWYPGHMTRAKRNIKEDLRLVDVVIEICDARVPRSSENPDIRKLTGEKERVVILNKADLADPDVTLLWIEKFRKEGAACISADSRDRNVTSVLRNALRSVTRSKRERDRERGMLRERAVKAMVAGIPNVGKSTLINSLTGKVSAKTGNKPGVTKGNQWINAGGDLLLLDTPGILWPKFEDKKVGYHLASIGSINDDILDKEDIAMFLLRCLLDHYRELLSDRYHFTDEEIRAGMEEQPEIPGLDREALSALSVLAEKRNCIKRGGVPDYEKASKLLIDDFRSGRIGRISLERPL